MKQLTSFCSRWYLKSLQIQPIDKWGMIWKQLPFYPNNFSFFLPHRSSFLTRFWLGPCACAHFWFYWHHCKTKDIMPIQLHEQLFRYITFISGKHFTLNKICLPQKNVAYCHIFYDCIASLDQAMSTNQVHLRIYQIV